MRATKAEKKAQNEKAQELYYVRVAFESFGSFNWREEPSVKIAEKATFFAIVNGIYLWANSSGVILGGKGVMAGADVFEAVKYLRLTLERGA